MAPSGTGAFLFAAIMVVVQLPMTAKMFKLIREANGTEQKVGIIFRWAIPMMATLYAYNYVAFMAHDFGVGYLCAGGVLAVGSVLWYGACDQNAEFGSNELLQGAFTTLRMTAPGAGTLTTHCKTAGYLLAHLAVVVFLWPLAPLVQWLRK